MTQPKDEPKRGRPPIDRQDSSVQLHTSVSSKQWSQLNQQARAAHLTVHQLVRQLLNKSL